MCWVLKCRVLACGAGVPTCRRAACARTKHMALSTAPGTRLMARGTGAAATVYAAASLVCLTCATSLPKAAASLTARSASCLRSRLMPATLRPLMNWP